METTEPLSPIGGWPSHELRQAIELLFFAYRDFTAAPDSILGKYGFGRAHRRIVYFVGVNPGISVNRLLGILRITKQSLSRVLGQLLREGFIVQRGDPGDRRLRLLHLTAKGEELERGLTESQFELVSRAFDEAGPEAVEGFRAVLLGLMGPEARRRFDGADA